MHSGVPAGILVSYPAPGKFIQSTGVVVVQDFSQLPTIKPDPSKGAVGIFGHRGLAFGDTFGPITQIKLDTWKAASDGQERGRFDMHAHGGDEPMDEVFIVLEGAAGFRWCMPGGPEQEVTLAATSMIKFPAGVRHAGGCAGDVDAQVLVIGVRHVTHPCDAGKKGDNIPSIG